jgi:hypothetical protein
MNKLLLTVTGCSLLALASLSPAQAFSGKHHAGKHHHHAHHYGHRAYFRIEPRFRRGLRNCGVAKRIAYLTQDKYWRYAYKSCRHDYYKYDY